MLLGMQREGEREEIHVRLILTATVAALLLLGINPSNAQESFFNKRYCSIPGGSNSGSLPDCSYNTWEQCRGGLSGTRYCAENPNWVPPERTKPRRASRK